jgi:hypothetical protein
MAAATKRAGSLIALLAAVVHLPGINVPIAEDEIHSVWQAARTIRDPQRLLLPWMGGAFRVLPKLVFMAGVQLWGPVAWPYKLLAVILYAWCSVLVSRVGAAWSGSARVGTWCGVLFAVGLGVYWKSVLVASNLTMLMGLLFLLLSADALWAGRWRAGLVLFLLAALSHEIVLVAPVLLPLLLAARREARAPTGSGEPVTASPALRPGRAVAVLIVALMVSSFLAGAAGRVTSTGVTMASFLLFPANPTALPGLGSGAGAVVARVAQAIVQHRFWIGLVVLAGLACLAWRGRASRALAIGWIVIFLIPGAFVSAGWQGDRLEIRYLALSAVGLCLVAGGLVAWMGRRRRALAAVTACVLIAWSLVIGALWLGQHNAKVHRPEWVAEREELRDALTREGFR